MRRYIVGGNWKSNGTVEFAKSFTTKVLQSIKFDSTKVEVVVAPNFLHLYQVQQALAGTQIQLSVQNTSLYQTGAYTGETAASQVKDFGINWAILGHSKRRRVFGESDEVVAKKTKLALESGLKIIECIGETLDERESGRTD